MRAVNEFHVVTRGYKTWLQNAVVPAGAARLLNAQSHNRTVAFRLVGKNSSRRIENRIPGADINPYLVYAAMLASGLEGLARKLEPVGQQAAGNAYERTDAPALPLTLHEATQAFAASPVVEKYFGKGVQDHYTNFGMQSVNAAASRVTDYERQMLLLDI